MYNPNLYIGDPLGINLPVYAGKYFFMSKMRSFMPDLQQFMTESPGKKGLKGELFGRFAINIYIFALISYN